MGVEILNVDCMEYMRSCEDEVFDLAVVDPWYGIGMGKNNASGFAKNRWTAGAPNKDSEIAPGEDFFIELRRVSKEQIIWGGNYFLEYLGNCKSPIVWDKMNGDNYFADGEMAWTSFKTGALRIFRHQWCGAFKDSERGEKSLHPCQKPVALYGWIYKRFAKDGERILDTNLGSGSSAVAAHRHGLDFVGCEIDKDYFDKAKNRLDEEISQVRMF